MENAREHKINNCSKKDCLSSESNYHTTKVFSEDILVTEMRKTQMFMNKPVCFGLSIS